MKMRLAERYGFRLRRVVRTASQEIPHISIGLFQRDAPLNAAYKAVLDDYIVRLDGELGERLEIFRRKPGVILQSIQEVRT